MVASGLVLVHNAAAIHTMDDHTPAAEALCIDTVTNRFVAVGSYANASAVCGAGARAIDMLGATVVPGLSDSHGHLSYMGQLLLQPDLTTATSVEAIVDELVAFVKTHPIEHGQWLTAFGWDQNLWANKTFPTRQQLDAAFPTTPVYMERTDGHAGWANTAALRAVPAFPTADPLGGTIVRDAQGVPTGVLIDNAMNLVENYKPKPTLKTRKVALNAVLRECAKNGLTSLHNPGVTAADVELWKEAIDKGTMTIRQYAMWLGVENLALGPSASPTTPMVDNYGNGMLNVKAVKFFMDGALGSWGAAMLAPYSDRPTESGHLRMTPEDFRTNVTAWHKAGYQLATHAIGDRANRLVIDTYRDLCNRERDSAGNVPDLRLRIEHFQIVNVDDIERIHFDGEKNGGRCILPSMQPTHAVGDSGYAETRIGRERLKGAYAWRRVLDTHADALPLGSDFPYVGTVPPLLGIYAAVTREDTSGFPHGGWTPSQRLTAAEALRGYTRDSAFASFQETDLGTIAVGKYADFVALNRDILRSDPHLIWNTTVLGTFVGGRNVFAHACWTKDHAHVCPAVDIASVLRDTRRRMGPGGDGCPH